MKRNAIGRIIIFSTLALILTGILVSGLSGVSFHFYQTGMGKLVEESAAYTATDIENLEINWAGGHVIVIADDVEQITIHQSKSGNKMENMYCALRGSTLQIDYSNRFLHAGKLADKDLVIHVPKSWKCVNLQINGGALDIELRDVTIGSFSLDGADCQVRLRGSVDKVDLDGADIQATLDCGNRTSIIEMDGAACQLNLTLPKDCGFRLEMDGIHCKFNSALPGINQGNRYTYGDMACNIQVEGISCDVTIAENPIWPIAE